MLEKELKSHYFVTLVWLSALVILRLLLNLKVFFNVISVVSWITFCLGAIAGTFLLDIDHILYTLVFNPQEPTSLKIKQLLRQKQYKEAFIFLVDTHLERVKLPLHNAIFQVVFSVFCFWVLTSTGSWFGKGLVMAVVLHLLKDEYHCFLKGKEAFLRSWLFWQIKREVSFREQKIFLAIMLLFFLGLNLLLI